MADSDVARVLIVDDEPIKRSVMEEELSAKGYKVASCANPLEAEEHLVRNPWDVVLTDLRMPGQDGLSFLRDLKERNPEQAVIVMTAYGTVETAVEAMKLGAYDYLQKPFATEELLLKLDRLLGLEGLKRENEALRRQLRSGETETRLVGRSAAIRAVLDRIHSVAATDVTVLIEGESGTGKELAARLLHETSYRRTGPFVAVSCASLPRDLIEAELFGHEAGAFTGAKRKRMGRFELAHGGTMFLDDVDDVPLEVQAKLLRVIQEGQFERIGSEKTIQIDFRLIAATKVNLLTDVQKGQFREDLFYRLNVVPLHIPPLRDRRDDIPILAEHFLARSALELNKGEVSIQPEAMRRLSDYHWPGNVRELKHAIERIVALARSEVLTVNDLPSEVISTCSDRTVAVRTEGLDRIDLAEAINDTEAQLIRWALARSGNNLSAAAERLGVPRSTLQYKISKLPSPAASSPAKPI